MSTAAPDTASIAKKAVSGTAWTYLSFLLGKGLAFVSTIVLARLLVPEQFGLMGLTLVGIQYLDIVNSFGVGSALVSRRDKVAEAANAAFVISIITGIFLYGVAWVGAPEMATFFKESSVTHLIRVLAIYLPINVLGVVPSAQLQRNLRFKAYLVPGLLNGVSKAISTVLLAWAGYGVWSLVWGNIIGTIVSTVTVWVIAPWRPTRQWDRRVTVEMSQYGFHVVIIGLVGALRSNMDYLFVGRVLGATALGLYTIAYRVPELLIKNLNSVVGSVAFPVLSQVQTESEQLRTIYRAYIRYITLFTFPLGLGIALIARPFVLVFYTAAWTPTIPVMQIIAIAIGLTAFGHVPGVLYKATNRPEVLSALGIIKIPIAFVVFWFSTRWGITGVAVGQLVIHVVSVVLDTAVVSRVVKLALQDTVLPLVPALLATAIMGLVVWSVSLLTPMHGIELMLLQVLLGILVYTAALLVVSRDAVTTATSTVRAAVARS